MTPIPGMAAAGGVGLSAMKGSSSSSMRRCGIWFTVGVVDGTAIPGSVLVGKAGGGPGRSSGTSRCMGRQGCVSRIGNVVKRLASSLGTTTVVEVGGATEG